MTLGKLALDVSAGIVVLALAGIAFIVAAGAVVFALTLASARRRGLAPAGGVNALAHGCSVNELAQIDEALDRIWSSAHGTTPGRGVR